MGTPACGNVVALMTEADSFFVRLGHEGRPASPAARHIGMGIRSLRTSRILFSQTDRLVLVALLAAVSQWCRGANHPARRRAGRFPGS
jgi:hypothetical protein